MGEYRTSFEVISSQSLPRLAESFHEHFDGMLVERAGQIVAIVYEHGESGVAAARRALTQLEDLLEVCVVRVDPDLVDGPEIAARLGVTRQAVGQWANGTRGTGFPHPIGSPGGKKIWTWGQITEWAARAGRLSEPPALTLDEGVEVDALLTARRLRVTRGFSMSPFLKDAGGSKRGTSPTSDDYRYTGKVSTRYKEPA